MPLKPLAHPPTRKAVVPPTFGQYVWYSGELRTGLITTVIPLYSTQWNLVMDDAGQLQGTAFLGDQAVRDLDLWNSAAMCRCFLALAYQDPDGTETFLEGGPIWKFLYSAAARTLQLSASGLHSYYDHRKVMKVLAPTDAPAAQVAEYDSVSLGTIAKRLIELAATHTAGDLPVVLPDDEVEPGDAAHTRTYPGYELDNVGDMLRNLTGDLGGPEIRFRPQRNPDDPQYLQWVLEVGTQEDPELHQVGQDFYWDQVVPKGAVADVSVTGDGTGMAGRAWVQGNGEAEGALIGVEDNTALIDAGYPLLEINVSGSESVEDVATLDAAATQALKGASGPVITITAKVQRDESPRLGTYKVGDYGQLQVVEHDLLPDGAYRSRITQISGDDSPQVSVDFAPTVGSLSGG